MRIDHERNELRDGRIYLFLLFMPGKRAGMTERGPYKPCIQLKKDSPNAGTVDDSHKIDSQGFPCKLRCRVMLGAEDNLAVHRATPGSIPLSSPGL